MPSIEQPFHTFVPAHHRLPLRQADYFNRFPKPICTRALVIGNHGALTSMSEKTREHLFGFWELRDELLNLVLFGLIGLEIIALSLHQHIVWLGLAAIPVVLLARGISVSIPRLHCRISAGSIPIRRLC
jgi:hypothetical protein